MFLVPALSVTQADNSEGGGYSPSGGQASLIVELNTQSGKLAQRAPQSSYTLVNAVLASPSRNFFAVAGRDSRQNGIVRIYDATQGEWLLVAELGEYSVSGWVGRGDTLVLLPHLYADGVLIWTPLTGFAEVPNTRGTAICTTVSGRSETSLLATTCRASPMFAEIDMRTGEVLWVAALPMVGSGDSLAIAGISPGNRWAVLKVAPDPLLAPDKEFVKRYMIVEIGTANVSRVPIIARFGNPNLVAWLDADNVFIVVPSVDKLTTSIHRYDVTTGVIRTLWDDKTETYFDGLVPQVGGQGNILLDFRRRDALGSLVRGKMVLNTATGETVVLPALAPYSAWEMPRQ